MASMAGESASKYLVLSDEALFAQCEFDRFRSHGPGGQKRNKTDSAVRLRHGPSGVVAIAVESRSQHENRAKALQRLRLELALKVRTEIELGRYAPSPLMVSCMTPRETVRRRGHDGNARDSTDQNDVEIDADSAGPSSDDNRVLRLTQRDVRKPQVYAELLDVIFAAEGQVSVAAQCLGISTGNLVRVLREETKVWGEVSRIRQRFGLPTLR